MSKIAIVVRLVFYALLSWILLVILWLALPSPSREATDDSNAYSTAVLTSGKTLTRVYDIEDFFPYNDPTLLVQQSRSTGRRSFALSYTVDVANQTITLDYPRNVLNITVSPSVPLWSDPFAVYARVGDQDGINPTWFSIADSTLLFWEIHKDRAQIWLRTRWSDPATFEVWPESRYFSTAAVNDGGRPTHIEPLLTIRNHLSTNEASFRAVLPTSATSSSPSSTYSIRVAILTILVPTGLALKNILQFCGTLISSTFTVIQVFAKLLTFYGLLEMIRWLVKGRPPVREHVRTSFPTRYIYAWLTQSSESQPRIWGATGPLEPDDIDEDDTNCSRARPLNGVWDFFRSNSPLDDLLVTFEMTSGWVKPISFRRTSNSEEESSSNGAQHSDVEQGRLRKSFSAHDTQKGFETRIELKK